MIARLKLKTKADVNDAQQALDYFNELRKDEDKIIRVVPNPTETLLLECVNVLKEMSINPMTVEEIVKEAGNINEDVRLYVGPNLKPRFNSKLKELHNLFYQRYPNNIIIANKNPIMLQWKDNKEDKTE
jgi:hypothetical protein